MTTPTGTCSLADVNNELHRSTTQNISMNDSAVRSLAGIGSGTISMASLRGRSSYTNVYGTGNNAQYVGDTGATLFPNAFTASCSPSVNPYYGTGSYTYSWSITSGSGFSLSNAGSQSCTVSRSIPRSGYYGGTCYLQCIISDGTSSYTVTNIQAYIEASTSA